MRVFLTVVLPLCLNRIDKLSTMTSSSSSSSSSAAPTDGGQAVAKAEAFARIGMAYHLHRFHEFSIMGEFELSLTFSNKEGEPATVTYRTTSNRMREFVYVAIATYANGKWANGVSMLQHHYDDLLPRIRAYEAGLFLHSIRNLMDEFCVWVEGGGCVLCNRAWMEYLTLHCGRGERASLQGEPLRGILVVDNTTVPVESEASSVFDENTSCGDRNCCLLATCVYTVLVSTLHNRVAITQCAESYKKNQLRLIKEATNLPTVLYVLAASYCEQTFAVAAIERLSTIPEFAWAFSPKRKPGGEHDAEAQDGGSTKRLKALSG